MIYYNARYYVPGIGRFASADTVVPDSANPQQFNRYSYVLGNPVGYVDPTGHNADCSPYDSNCDGLEADSPNTIDPLAAIKLAWIAYKDATVKDSRLSFFELLYNVTDIANEGIARGLSPSEIAYALVTAQMETHMGYWFEEAISPNRANEIYAPSSDRGKSLGNTEEGDGYLYRGRGYVQLTGRAQYTAYGIEDNPDSLLTNRPFAAYILYERILNNKASNGNPSLSDYSDNGQVDYAAARAVVNGDVGSVHPSGNYPGTVGAYMDDYGKRFEAVLTTALGGN